MLQFGELLTLGLSLVAGVYVILHYRPIRSVQGLRPLVLPFLLVVLAFLATVIEGIPGGNDAQIIFWEQSPLAVREGGWLSALLNLVEHLAYMAAAVSLAVILWRQRPGKGATPS